MTDNGKTLFGVPTVAGENERTVSGQVLAPFAFYVLSAEGGKASYAFKDMSKPEIRVTVRVKEGPTGTEGGVAFLTLPLYVSHNKPTGETDPDGKMVFIPKEAAELEDDYAKAQKRLNRIARVGKFRLPRAAGIDGDSLDAYAGQFTGFDFVGDVRVDRRGEKKGYNAINTIWWDSIAALDDLAMEKKNKDSGLTALEEARLKIANANRRGPAKSKQAETGA